MLLSIKKHKIQAVLISFTKVTIEAPAVYVQRIFLNVLIFHKFIPPCLTPLRYNQREEAWASWPLQMSLTSEIKTTFLRHSNSCLEEQVNDLLKRPGPLDFRLPAWLTFLFKLGIFLYNLGIF